jgi:hypothetical protein
MAGTLVEIAALEADSHDERRVALARLSALGPVILLAPDDGLDPAAGVAGAEGYPDLNLVVAAWPGVGAGQPEAWQPRPGGGRLVDRRALEQLIALRAEHDAAWLIATDRTLATARACPGLRIACVGPALDRSDPVRPDHQAHSLLDAVRQIEASSTFA